MTLSYFMQSVSKRLKKASDKAAQETHCKDESSIFFVSVAMMIQNVHDEV